jgi:hypothetical protein
MALALLGTPIEYCAITDDQKDVTVMARTF